MRMRRLFRAPLATLLLSGAAMAGIASGASAQTAAPSADDDAASAVEDITVTARRSQERLQDVPLSVTAYSSATIVNRGIRDPADISQLAPSLNFQAVSTNRGGGASNKLQMRGLSSSAAGTSKASVFIDGIYQSVDYASFPLISLERIEVLPGPQSALFGRATFAGALSYVTRTPTDHFEANIVGELASRGQQSLSAWIGGPLSGDKFTMAATGYYYNRDGPDSWRTPDGFRLGSQKTESGSIKFVGKPTETLTLTGFAMYSQDHDLPAVVLAALPSQRTGRIVKANGAVTTYYAGAVDPIAAVPANLAFNLNNFDGSFDDPGLHRKSYRYYLRADQEIGDYNLMVMGSHALERVSTQSDADSTSVDSLRSVTFFRDHDEQVEARLSSPQDKPFRFALGGFYLYQASNDIRTTTTNPSTTRIRTPRNRDLFTEDKSVFGAVYWDLTDHLTLNLEGRYQEEKVRQRDNLSTNVVTRDLRATYKAFLPRATLQYKVNSNIQAYALFSRGNNPGGFNVGEISKPEERAFKEEKLDNYEAGFKSVWMGGKVLFNVSAYHMIWNDQQSPFTYPSVLVPGGTFTVTINQGKSQVDGVEAELQLIPARGLNVRGGLSYNHARYKSYCSPLASTFYGGSDLPAPNACLYINGNNLESSPKLQGSLSADYTTSVFGDYDGVARVQYSYTGRQYDSELNLAWVDPVNIINGSIGLQGPVFGVEVFGRNLTNSDAPTRATRTVDGRIGNLSNTFYTPRFPRQVGIRLTYKM